MLNDAENDTGSRRRGVLVVGSANMDMVVACERFPRPGETVLGRDFETFPGGKGANQAVACARLGGRVQFLGKMGADPFRESLTASLIRDGVRLDGLLTDDEAATGVAVITVDARGENTIVVASGSNMRLTPADLDAHEALFAGAAVVLAQLEVPLETVSRAAELAHVHGATFILNPAPARPLPDALLAQVDFLTPNETEAAQLAGFAPDGTTAAEVAARTLLRRGVRHVLVTVGEEGVLLVTEGGVERFPAFRVAPVDTTAAGDAFNGALAFALAEGQPLDEAVRLANAVAACAVT
ncbi:MAG TPA: ribokinase, partial [Rubricoccaceae bacterium]|nr:ribokinase [Rubricoccaceae bacterium]